MKLWPFQYQGLTAPPPVDPAPTEPPFGWLPTYPDHVFPTRSLSAAILAGAFFMGAPDLAVARQAATIGQAQVFPGQSIQYPASVAPFQAALQVVVTLDWLPIYPDRIEPSGGLGAEFQQYISLPTEEPAAPLDWLSSYPDRLERRVLPTGLLPSSVWTPQHQDHEGSALDWWPRYPDRLDPARRVPEFPALALDPFPRPTEVVLVYTTPIYPDRIDRLPFLTAHQQAFALPPFIPVDDLRWAPTYPDAVFRSSVRASDQRAAFIPTFLPIFDLRWEPEYPDRIPPLPALLPAAQQALALWPSPIPEVHFPSWVSVYPDRIYPPPRLRTDLQLALARSLQPEQTIAHAAWSGSYPAWLERPAYPTALQLPVTLEPFPRPGAVTITAWAIYPDFVIRVQIHPSRVPAFSYGTWEFIPNPPVVQGGDEKIHLGTKESIGVTIQPTLGGWHAW